jgi:hypothetical protein
LNQSKTIHIEGIGKVLFEPSERAKHLNVSVRPFKGVRVAVPRRTSFEAARDFVGSKTMWIRRHLGRMNQVEADHQAYAKLVANIDEAETRQRISGRVHELGKKHGFVHNRVFVRNLKSRWGSCSLNNNISLNMRLAVLPKEMLDYVILHELVHTRVRNHSKGFWMELEKCVEEPKVLDAQLRRYHAILA